MKATTRTSVATLRVLFGAIWLVNAYFKWQPGFRSGFAAQLRDMVGAQPAVVKPWFQFWAFLATGTGHAVPDVIAVTETALGIALILGVARRPVYIAGGVYALMVWAVGEGFGGPYALGTSTDVGAALIYVFVFAGLWMLDPRGVAPRWSLDRVITQARPGWMRVAELRLNPATPSITLSRQSEGGLAFAPEAGPVSADETAIERHWES
jgi:uncharacterized membrane protein YphA (DoxX/SURF4 family)